MRFNKSIYIGDAHISEEGACYVIAEAGVNHNGDIDIARKMVDAAAEAGADAVKFQMFRTEDLILSGVRKAPYQRASKAGGKSQFEMLKALELGKKEHAELFKYCGKKGITYLCTPYDDKSLNALIDIGIKAVKIASTDATNLFFIEKAARKKLPVIFSTGMSDMREIEKSVECLYANGCRDLVVLHCTSSYPTKPEEVNLRSMLELKYRFDAMVGFSDHTVGAGAAPYAVSLGARVLEKHFTLDKRMDGPDHKASLAPSELKTLIGIVRQVETMLGSGKKVPAASEKTTKLYLRKYMTAKKPIKKGTVIRSGSLCAKRTGGNGLSPILRELIIGKTALKDIKTDEPIYLDHVR
jgi:N-acetylneuraminate synthase